MNAFVITSGITIVIVVILYYFNNETISEEMRSEQNAPRYKHGLGYTNPKRLTKN